MTNSVTSLIDALRQELQQYGEMLARLDQQQHSIMRRAADDVLASVTAVQDQGAAIQTARHAREQTQRQLARHLGQPEKTTLTKLAEKMPPDYQLLVRALMDENNHLLVRVQQRARQNHLLLRRSLELMRDLLHDLFPAGQRGLYDHGGRARGRNLHVCGLFDLAG